jgi:hypothetical protein
MPALLSIIELLFTSKSEAKEAKLKKWSERRKQAN